MNRKISLPIKSGIIGLFLSLMCSSALANVILTGQMIVGDNDASAIEPRFIIQENYLGRWQPGNAINFHLSEKILLKNIRLENAYGIDAQLYFVIWDNRNNVVYDKMSSYYDYSQTATGNTELVAGDYQLAVVGQCYDRRGNALGWANDCKNDVWKGDSEDFGFTNITLVSPDSSKSKAFIQRRHIGDSKESSRHVRGYPGRWYPDRYEAEKIVYSFRVASREQLEKLTIYGYRDLSTNENNIRLEISDPTNNRLIASKYLRSWRESGNFSWDLSDVSTTLVPGRDYRLTIKYPNNSRDLDDISWDDIVLKDRKSVV